MIVPNMPGWENSETAASNYLTLIYTLPDGCTKDITLNTSQIIYNGPNLPNSGVLNGDDFSTVLEKIDNSLA